MWRLGGWPRKPLSTTSVSGFAQTVSRRRGAEAAAEALRRHAVAASGRRPPTAEDAEVGEVAAGVEALPQPREARRPPPPSIDGHRRVQGSGPILHRNSARP